MSSGTSIEQRVAEALRAAIAGEHPFVLVDMNAPMRTIDLESARPKVRLSPDVWRSMMAEALAPLEPPPYVEHEPAFAESMRFEVRVRMPRP